MKKVTLADVIKSVPERWAQQYREWNPDRALSFGRTPWQVGRDIGVIVLAYQTADLTEDRAVDLLTKAIGNPSWTRMQCSICHRETKELLVGGGVSLCRDCHKEH